MLTILVNASVGFAVTAFAIAVMLREFRQHWSQIAAALAFDGQLRAPAPATVRRPAALRQTWPAPVRLPASQRAAA